MKKYVILGLVLMISTLSFAQKKELKEAERAIKESNYADARSSIQKAESMMSAMDAKTKAKYHFLKGQALYANGAGSDADVSEALKSFSALREIEAVSGKKVYTPKIDVMKVSMSNNFYKKAQDALEQKNYEVSSANFESAYRVSNSDTLYLYNAALLATSAKNYDRALTFYDELMSLGYTGVRTEYFATEIETGEEQEFPDVKIRDISVNIAKTHNNSRNVKSETKSGEIAKNIALIYIDQGQNDKAMAAIEKAKSSNPGDVNLILAEANVRYKLGEIDKYKELITEALVLEPNNIDLVFNLGVISAEQGDFGNAREYYNKAIAMDPTYTRAYMNSAALLLDQEQGIIDEMNGLGSSAADDKRYEELRADRSQLYKDAIPYLKSALENEPDNLSAARTLMNIYSSLDDMPNFNAMKSKVDELEGNN